MSDLSRLTLRDLLYSVVNTNGTINATTATATDILRAVITESTTSTNWSNTVVSYDVSGYTIPSSDPAAVLTDFYCNTGVTLQVLLTGDTIIQSYISGTTIVPTGTTITEIATTTTGTTITPNNYLNVQISGTTTGSTTGTLIATDYLYFGDTTSDGSWRMAIVGADLIIQRKILGNWVQKGSFTGS